MNLMPESPASLPRRRFLKLAALVGAGAATVCRPFLGWDEVFAQAAGTPFAYGVAAGDPLPDRIIIWTRVTPSPDATPGSGLGADAAITWQVSPRRDFTSLTASGTATVTVATDHTLKVDVTGLSPRTAYFYRFLLADGTASSRVGQMRTAPAVGSAVNSLRFGVTSCSNYEGGYFAAYRYLAQRTDLDFIIHLGDYIYEYVSGGYGPGPAIGRVHDPVNEIVSLSDYRRRHAQHKLDPDLQLLHARYPFITTWDDHEVADNSYNGGAVNHQPATEGDFFVRRAFAYRAYIEWMPIRLPDPSNTPTRIYRRFEFGSLADLSMLDLRQYRDVQAANGATLSDSQPPPAREIDDPDRTITGRQQLDWIKGNLSTTSTRWKFVGNSVIISPVDFSSTGATPAEVGLLGQLLGMPVVPGVPYNTDQWDGYRDDRHELLTHVANHAIDNVVFLTGDIHSSWACDVPVDPAGYPGASPSVAVEFVGTSVTADNLNEILGQPPRNATSIAAETAFKDTNRHVKLLEFDSHGYSVVDVTPERVQMDWFWLTERTDPNSGQRFGTSWLTRVGTNAIQPASGPLSARPLA